MGQIHRHPLRKWREQYGLRAFVETGTWKGDGVQAALAAGYPEVWTVEASSKLAEAARLRLGWAPVRVVVGDSVEKLPEFLEHVPKPALFWLDAHYPERYEGGDGERLPLLAEVAAIVGAERDHSGDVILADDLRIYGLSGQSGPLPGFLPAGNRNDLEDIERLLEPTHDVTFDGRDDVYLVALPRGA